MCFSVRRFATRAVFGAGRMAGRGGRARAIGRGIGCVGNRGAFAVVSRGRLGAWHIARQRGVGCGVGGERQAGAEEQCRAQGVEGQF